MPITARKVNISVEQTKRREKTKPRTEPNPAVHCFLTTSVVREPNWVCLTPGHQSTAIEFDGRGGVLQLRPPRREQHDVKKYPPCRRYMPRYFPALSWVVYNILRTYEGDMHTCSFTSQTLKTRLYQTARLSSAL